MKNVKRQNLTASFDRYETANGKFKVKIYIRDIKNDKGVIIALHYCLKGKAINEILDNFVPDEKIVISAILEETPWYGQGFKVRHPIIITKK